MIMKNILITPKIFITVLAALLLAILLSACKANEQPAPVKLGQTEFVVVHKNSITEQQLRSIFKSVEPFRIVSSTATMTIIRFNYDPGLVNLKKIVETSNLIEAIHPNYRYQKFH